MSEHVDYPGSYEQARAELRDILAKLESGAQPLEESLALWERGELLADVCERWLQGASSRLDGAMDAATEGDADAASAAGDDAE